MADASAAAQVVLTANVTTLVIALVVLLLGILMPLGGAIWGVVNWAYKQRIDALNERLALANDRLGHANEELARVRQELENVRRDIPAAVLPRINQAIEGITASMRANTVTITATGAGYMAGADRSGTPLPLVEEERSQRDRPK